MKRDVELVRQILMKVEQSPPMDDIDAIGNEPDYSDIEYEPDIKNYPDHKRTLTDDDRFTSKAIYRREIISSHVQLLREAGLIKAVYADTVLGEMEWRPYELTWTGHEFVDASRQEDIDLLVSHFYSQPTLRSGGLFILDDDE